MMKENEFVEGEILPLAQIKAIIEVYPEMITIKRIETWTRFAKTLDEVRFVVEARINELVEARINELKEKSK